MDQEILEERKHGSETTHDENQPRSCAFLHNQAQKALAAGLLARKAQAAPLHRRLPAPQSA